MSAQKEKMSTGKAIFTVVMSVISVGMAIYFDLLERKVQIEGAKNLMNEQKKEEKQDSPSAGFRL